MFFFLFGFCCSVASVVIILAEVVFALVQLYNPSFVVERWHIFLVFLAVNILSVLFNIFGAVRMPWIGKAFCKFVSRLHQAKCLVAGAWGDLY